MSKPLRVLLIEDSERDAALLLLYLRRGGYDPTLQRVENESEMATHLQSGEWDIVISDFNLPSFTAHDALRVLMNSTRTIPFLVLSGGIPPDEVDKIMKEGANHFVLKENMPQITTIIEKAILAK